MKLGPAASVLLPQVRANCLRADAQVAGLFSMCGLLLRLRNLYKWEHGLPPWREEEPPPVLAWVSQREEAWESLPEVEPLDLRLDGATLDPFDTAAVNALLGPEGLVYGAGRVAGLLPVFFLGRLVERRRLDGLTVWELGQELTQDIFFLPGLTQENQIFLRKEPLSYLLWDKLADPRAHLRRFVRLGLTGYGLDPEEVLTRPTWENLAPVVQGELAAIQWHEVGEATDGLAGRDLLHRAATEHPGTELEHFVRGVKDILADTGPHGRLAYIIAGRRAGSLGLYPTWLAGFPRLLFPEIDAAVALFAGDGDWSQVEECRELGWQRALAALAGVEEVLAACPVAEAVGAVRREVIGPLTGFRSVPDES
ncbi:MAG: hypothetical protein KQJ78_12630 [Deltaproteobacteria bacterium]|nr:hypothetical protein [Deltaproteobacteria bacterium]